MRKLAAMALAVGSAALFTVAVTIAIADTLDIVSASTLLHPLPPRLVPNHRPLAFVENLLLSGCLLLAAGAIFVSGIWRRVPLELARLRKCGLWPSLTAGIRKVESSTTGPRLAIPVVLLTIASIISLKGATAHPELRIYIPHYLSNQPVLVKLFDFRGTEMQPDIYEPRQLSYLIDMLDAYGVADSVRIGVPHFISISYYLMWAAMCFTLWRVLRSGLDLDPLTSALLILLVQTTPGVFFSGTFYRSAKPGMAMCALGATLLMFRLLKPEKMPPMRRHFAVAGVCALLFSAALFDMMGLCLISLAILHAALEWWRRPGMEGKRTDDLELAVCLIATLCLYAVWNYRLAPAISQHLIGQRPGFFYQNGTLKSLLVAPVTDSVWSVVWFLDICRYLLGNLPIPVMLLSFLYLAAKAGPVKDADSTHAAQPVPSGWPRWRLAAHAALATVGLMGIARILVARHLPLLWVDVRRSTYGLPFTLGICILTAALISAVFRARRVDRSVVQVALMVLLVGNLVSLPEHRTILVEGHLKAASEESDLLRQQLRLPPGATVPEVIRRDPVYVTLERFRTAPK